jgi:hypothetical protein
LFTDVAVQDKDFRKVGSHLPLERPVDAVGSLVLVESFLVTEEHIAAFIFAFKEHG